MQTQNAPRINARPPSPHLPRLLLPRHLHSPIPLLRHPPPPPAPLPSAQQTHSSESHSKSPHNYFSVPHHPTPSSDKVSNTSPHTPSHSSNSPLSTPPYHDNKHKYIDTIIPHSPRPRVPSFRGLPRPLDIIRFL